MKRTQEIATISALVLTVGSIVYFSIGFNIELFRIFFGEFEQFFGRVGDENFVRNAVLIKFLWELLPRTVQVVSISAINLRLLQTGISPIILGIITATGRLIGQIFLYFIGRYIAHYVLKDKRRTASASHFLHKYHYIVFFIPAFVGIFGDFIMLTAGHQKVNLLKILPILFAGDLADAYRWIYWDLAQLEIVKTIQ